MNKSLKEKAIDIKGKQYVLVADRVLYFNETYPNGSISTEVVSALDSQTVVVKATVIPDYAAPERKFTGYSQAVIGDGYINKTSALENAETSAVGRALAFMGIGVIESIASVDEINKATSSQTPKTRFSAKRIENKMPDTKSAFNDALRAIQEATDPIEIDALEVLVRESKELSDMQKDKLYAQIDEKRQ